jgi:hypothetical protein
MAPSSLLACLGCFKGYPAVISLVIAILALIGTIYMLLWSNYGAREAYLILMVALFGWMLLLSSIWLFGIPGTTPSTGPRAREPAWISFLPDSDQAGDFAAALDEYPNGWDPIGELGKKYPGNIESKGELANVGSTVEEALARLARKQGTKATEPDDWSFFPNDQEPATEEERTLPQATVRYVQTGGGPLLFGVTIPSTAKHPQVTVFAFRDKGLVFLYAVYALGASLLGFLGHLFLLARYERKQKERDAQLALEPALT